MQIMTDNADEVGSILVGKTTMKYTGAGTEAMSALASAAKKRSLAEFNQASLPCLSWTYFGILAPMQWKCHKSFHQFPGVQEVRARAAG
jgi:hypothetical protein